MGFEGSLAEERSDPAELCYYHPHPTAGAQLWGSLMEKYLSVKGSSGLPASPPQHLLPKHCQFLLSTFSPSDGNSNAGKGDIGPIYCQTNSDVLLVSSAFVAFLQSSMRSLTPWKMLPLISWARGDRLNECLCMCSGLTVVTWSGGSRKDKAFISPWVTPLLLRTELVHSFLLMRRCNYTVRLVLKYIFIENWEDFVV